MSLFPQLAWPGAVSTAAVSSPVRVPDDSVFHSVSHALKITEQSLKGGGCASVRAVPRSLCGLGSIQRTPGHSSTGPSHEPPMHWVIPPLVRSPGSCLPRSPRGLVLIPGARCVLPSALAPASLREPEPLWRYLHIGVSGRWGAAYVRDAALGQAVYMHLLSSSP